MFQFTKYHGAGNDFILVDARSQTPSCNQNIIKKLCHRRFGIGADGLILLLSHPKLDFEMKYFNADGNESTMCGNGGRCIIRYAHDLFNGKKSFNFLAIDGIHTGEILNNDEIQLGMSNVPEFIKHNLGDDSAYYFVDTGSPHLVFFENDLVQERIQKKATYWRNHDDYREDGVNINFVVKGENNVLQLETFERGVEDFTYACGTGAVAAALMSDVVDENHENEQYKLITRGGILKVKFIKTEDYGYVNILLVGPAVAVFDGTVNLKGEWNEYN